MKASELRIGNLLLKDGVIVTIDGRSIFDMWGVELGFSTHGYSPIPFTEQWLINFGAEVEEFKQNQYRIGNRLFVLRGGYWTDYGSSVSLRYVHQFQNFYFALTGQECSSKN